MIEFGIETNPRLDVLKELKAIAGLKVDFVELGIERPGGSVPILKKYKNKILNLLEKNNLYAIGHTDPSLKFGSLNEKERKVSLKMAKEMIKMAALLQMKLMNFHFYNRYDEINSEEERKIFLRNFSNSMKLLIKFAKSKKITLMLENLTHQHYGITHLEDFEFVIKRNPSLKVHLDVGHAYLKGGMEEIENYIKKFKKKIVHLHMHDNRGHADEHLAIGKGTINYRHIIKLLKKINFNKTITLEVFSGKKDAVASIQKIKKLWKHI